MSTRQLSDDELVDLCLTHGIRLEVPLSQLEAEAIRRGVELATVIRAFLLTKLEEVGAL
jgi:hypothetical protein